MNNNTDYIGIAVDRLSDGSIFQVIVETKDGHVSTLMPEEYEAKGILPQIDQLPDKAKN
jgi:hypothetical protein